MPSRGVAQTLGPSPDIELIGLRTHFRDGDEVAAFLKGNPGIVLTLLEALDRIPEFFGEDVPVALEVLWDPEDPEHEELYALIQTKRTAEDAVSRLKRFDEAWWLNALDHTRGALTISLEFV